MKVLLCSKHRKRLVKQGVIAVSKAVARFEAKLLPGTQNDDLAEAIRGKEYQRVELRIGLVQVNFDLGPRMVFDNSIGVRVTGNVTVGEC